MKLILIRDTLLYDSRGPLNTRSQMSVRVALVSFPG